MKFNCIDGKVPYIMAAGKDFVSSAMSQSDAERICAAGTKISTRFPGYPISVDNKYFFAATSIKPQTRKHNSP